MSTPIRKVVISICLWGLLVLYAGFNGGDVEPAGLTPGYCLVGTVVYVGLNCVSGLKVGDTIAALTVHNAQSERINLPEQYAIRVQPGIDLQQATALVLVWYTAMGMVKHVAKVTTGQRVFVHGCSGAMGYGIMKLCQMQGAKVYGTAPERNHTLIRQQGGKPFVYTDKGWIHAVQEIGGVDAVFDALGFESRDESWSILKSTGILIGYGGSLYKLTNETAASGRSITWAVTKLYLKYISLGGKRARLYVISKDDSTFEPHLQALFALNIKGRILVPIEKIWQLDQIREAHESWAKDPGVGSLLQVVQVTP
ncbi:putative Zinc-binding dehydrogenase [Seiridium cardinale]|uniref:Zinc-binding dehydrogenase n=1 Tax=Seiridium cardinale TaxID=138064 RepID=A0ABR2Y5K1_9PEZI